MAAAATVAGLLLFGRRDASNNLRESPQEWISRIGFGAAAFSTFMDYLSPETARRLLRQGARGHVCMANQSEMILSVWDEIVGLETERNTLSTELRTLDLAIAAVPSDFEGREEAVAIRDAGYEALALFQTQQREMLNAHLAVGETAWDFGIDLMTSADRQAVDVAALVQSLNEQAASNSRFEEAEELPEEPAGNTTARTLAAQSDAQKSILQTEQTLVRDAASVASRRRRLLNNLPNVQALVLGFETCAATALVGGDPRMARIQRIAFEN